MSFIAAHRIELDMAQQPSSPPRFPSESQDQLFATRREPCLSTGPPGLSVGLAGAGPRIALRTRVVREVAVVEVAGRLGDVVQDLDQAIELALAQGPRGVVCDLSRVSDGLAPKGVNDAGSDTAEMLASAGRHSRDWPGIPVAVAGPGPGVREALRAHSLGAHLIVSESLFSAVTEVLATPAPAAERLRLAPHPTAPRAARDFVTRTLLDWRLGLAIPFATFVVSELVASSSVNAGTEIDLSVAWNLGVLRLAVRDHGSGLPRQGRTAHDLRGRALNVVADLSRTFGVLPTADGGKVVWAVLEAPRPHSGTGRIRSMDAATTQISPVFTDGRGMAELPFCAGFSRQPT